MLFCMSSLGGKISATVVGAALVGVLGFGAVQVVQAADARSTEPAVVQVADFGTEAYDPATVLDAQADKAAREEAARIEAERVAAEAAAAEAARVAAEQAAAAEAARVAAEQEASYDEPSEPAPSDPAPVNRIPVPFVVDPNPENAAGGFYDVSQCPTGSASTGSDGVPYCD